MIILLCSFVFFVKASSVRIINIEALRRKLMLSVSSRTFQESSSACDLCRVRSYSSWCISAKTFWLAMQLFIVTITSRSNNLSNKRLVVLFDGRKFLCPCPRCTSDVVFILCKINCIFEEQFHGLFCIQRSATLAIFIIVKSIQTVSAS